MGLVHHSTQCRLICQLYKGDSTRHIEELQLATPPGTMVIFNGNKLWHSITPLEAGAERIVLTMEYVTNPAMGSLQRFVSNMKDAIAYFGFSTVLRGILSGRRGSPASSHNGRQAQPDRPASC